MASKVYFTDMRTKPDRNIFKKLDEVMNRAGIDTIDFKDKFTAVKLSFGEPGNIAYLRPNFVAAIVKKIKDLGGRPFLTDANTLYYGKRSNAVDHLETAMLHGFNRMMVGCDVMIADGLTGLDAVEIPINLKHVQNAKIGSLIHAAEILISVTHFKGHIGTGIGGALKNVGMGCGSRKGKLEMHSSSKPKMKQENCVACGVCIKNCPENAIAYNKDHKAEIDYSKCIGCGQCVASCHYGAAVVVWDEAESVMCEKMAEYAYAVLKDKPHFHISFMLNITPDCDCFHSNDQAIAPDVGIAASFDPVALDRACVDLVNQAPFIPNSSLTDKGSYAVGEDKFQHIHPATHWQDCLDHAQEIGLGSQEYTLVKIA